VWRAACRCDCHSIAATIRAVRRRSSGVGQATACSGVIRDARKIAPLAVGRARLSRAQRFAWDVAYRLRLGGCGLDRVVRFSR